ncbi:MAG: DUF1302 family protein, partial [Myxococcota bacterium]|nr:DUF1302 family protein [Myxococcota bacterium]
MDGLGAARRFGFVLVAGVLLGGFADRAQALEAFDGKLQAHGFVEIQARGLDRSYAEEFDLSQWYNVLNLEVEFDLVEDGWGPFDLLSGFIRAEGRYDCIYSGGCGMFPSVNTFGNKSRDLPLRLRDGDTKVFSGVVDMTDQADPPGVLPLVPPETRDPVQWSVAEVVETEVSTDVRDPNTFTPTISNVCPTTGFSSNANQAPLQPGTWTGCVDNRPEHTEIVKRKGFPGFDTLFDLEGADGELHDFQDYASVNRLLADPTFQAFQASLGVNASDWSFYDQRIRDPNFVIPTPAGGTGDNTQRWRYQYGKFFRGLVDERDDPGYYTLLPVYDWRFTFRSFPGPEPNGEYLPMGPWLPKNFFGTTAALDDRANPLRGRKTPTLMVVNNQPVRADGTRYNELDCGEGLGAATANCDNPAAPGYIGDVPVDPVDSRLFQLEKLLGAVQGNFFLYDDTQDPEGPSGVSFSRLWNLDPYPNGSAWNGVFGNTLFGGDYSGIIPCWDTNKTIANRSPATPANSRFVDQLASSGVAGNTLIRNARYGCIPLTNVRVTGGDGELPMRVAPDFSNLSNTEFGRSQGLYLPSYGFLDYIESGGSINDHQFNISEIDRSFNRGYAQRETYELKEAYLDMEFLESRLWVRAGIQNIVWGKTELFRTTDQFNPQDFALSSLPSLEEARIALLSARAVYSFYDVGPLEDVRFELAVNFDRFQPTDLGACGEPYTLDVVCALTLGTAIHGVTGLGVAGIDAYPDGYKDVDGLEFGGRLEFRWDRFSFAIMDFYGYSDFPYPDVITYYERNVDPSTGMPRKGGATGSCANRAGFVATNVFTSDAATEFLIQAGNPALEAANPGVAAVKPVGLRDVIASGQVAPGGLDAANDDWWRRKEAYGLLGIGTDPDCLKPGGAPGLANENRYDAALAPSLEAFLETNPVSAYSNATGAAADQLAGSASTFMVETVGGTAGDQIQWTNVGVSQDYALRYHPANQQLFHFICSATVSIAVALAPGACAWNLWGTDAKLIQDFEGPPFGDLIGGGFAGNQTNGYYFNFYNQIISATKGETINAALTVPVAPLNSDVRDGRTTSMVSNFHDTGLNFRGNFFGQARLEDTPRDFLDFLTLDNT